jgi:uncharacterized protein YdaU (DUF1376 family)
MHHYDFHVGDYMKDTAHLTNEEDLCYRRLLDMYYDQEGPITSDTKWVARRIRIGQTIVDSVLSDFFVFENSSWHNKRADEVISAYKQFAEAGKKGAQKRWGGNEGATKTPLAIDSPPIAPLLPPQSQIIATLPDANSNHKPETINQEPETKNQESKESLPPAACQQKLSLPPEPLPATRACQMPESFTPNESSLMLAKTLGVSVEVELPKFKDFNRMHGRLGKDWQAGFKNWLRKAAEYRAPQGVPAGAKMLGGINLSAPNTL